jgi:hypothetical protein
MTDGRMDDGQTVNNNNNNYYYYNTEKKNSNLQKQQQQLQQQKAKGDSPLQQGRQLDNLLQTLLQERLGKSSLMPTEELLAFQLM